MFKKLKGRELNVIWDKVRECADDVLWSGEKKDVILLRKTLDDLETCYRQLRNHEAALAIEKGQSNAGNN